MSESQALENSKEDASTMYVNYLHGLSDLGSDKGVTDKPHPYAIRAICTNGANSGRSYYYMFNSDGKRIFLAWAAEPKKDK